MPASRQMRRRCIPQLRSKAAAINVLRFIWVLAVLWCELGAFFWSIAWCRWPRQIGGSASRVLLVADPLVPRPCKGWLPNLTWVKQHVVNHNLRKSWMAANSLRPDAVVFLGDMLRHGSKVKETEEYGDYVAHFRSIFQMNTDVPFYFVPGNRDVGLGPSRTFSSHIRDRFETHFGPTNRVEVLKNQSLILLDAPALVEEDYRRHGAKVKFSDWLGVARGSIDLVKSLATKQDDRPVILFSHIPLARADGASCGPLREYGNIRRGVGRGYQTLLGRETSRFLLLSTMPSVVFSADDHDYCEYVHTVTGPDGKDVPVREVTVKSFSMATRLQRPGFQLLSLFDLENLELGQSSYADTQCLLPNQSHIYTHGYAPLVLVTLLLLMMSNMRRHRVSSLDGNQSWGDAIALHGDEPSATGSTHTNVSPPASPIHYKHSRSVPHGLRSASTLTPYPSHPPTPLGGTPLLSSTFPHPSSAEDEDGQELLFWPGQLPTPKVSPYPNNSPGMDSSYFLPSPGIRPVAPAKKSIWLPDFGSRTRLTVRNTKLLSLLYPIMGVARILWCGGYRRARTRQGRFMQEIFQVALPPMLVYVGILLWLSG